MLALFCSNNSARSDINVNNWADLKTQVESGTSVNLDLSINAEGTIYPSGTVIINGNLYSIDGGDTYRILHNSANLTIYDADFTNGQESQGGILYNQGILNIIRGTYSNSHAWDGGGLYLTGSSTAELNNAEFSGNMADGDGAAIYNQGSLNISSVNFDSNQASSNGGAIYNALLLGISGGTYASNSAWNGGALYLTNTSTANAENLIFNLNTANGNGGAIYNQGSLTLINTDFSSNQSSSKGGAIYNENVLNISGGEYSGNSSWDGGAIYLTSLSNAEIENAIFTRNTANGYGGAIHNLGTLTLSDITIGGALISDSNSSLQGGGIYSSNKLTLNGGNFSNNEAQRGGALYLTSTAETGITGTNFLSNLANNSSNPSSAVGGAIFNEASLNISGGDYSGNLAWDGGALYLGSSSQTEIKDVLFDANSATGYGGAIYNSGDLELGFLTNGVTFLGNSSINGGAIYNSNKLTIDGATFGKREGLGTAEDPYVYSNGNVTATTGSWQGGGAIFNSTGTVNISGNTSFFNNSAVISDTTIVPSGGGAIYNNSGTLNIIATDLDSIVFQNNSSTSGGAIYNSGNFTITNALFGAVRGSGTDSDPYVYSGGNTANATGNYQGGGAIYNSSSNLNINGNTNFYGNIANVNNAPNLNGGGAIYTNSGTVNITSDTDSITFGGNEATRGGALYNNFGTINLKATSGDINFVDNKATAYGGALYNFVATTNLYAQGGDILFRNNTATTLGDSIYNDQGTLNLRAQTGNKIVFDDTVYNSTGSSIINVNQNDGTDYLGTVEFNNSVNGIYNPAINLYNGILKLGHTYQSDGTTVRSAGTITNNDIHLYGGTIDMMDGVVGNYINAPNLSIAKDSSIGLKFDVDLSNATTDYFTLSNGLVNSGTGTNNGVFRIDDINVLHDATATNTSLTLFTGSNTPSLSQIIGATIDTTLYRYVVSQDSSNLGQLIFTRQSYFDRLYDAVKAPEITRTLAMTSNIDVMTNLNDMTGTNGELTVNGSGYSIDGKGYNGVIIASGQKYNINNVSNYSNFVSTLGGAIKNAGTLNISDTTFLNNNAATSGGAIYNTGTATLTNVNFGERTGLGTTEDPYVYSNGNAETTLTTNYQGGGAIYNTGTLNILGSANYFGNIVNSTNSYSGGGAIYNYSGITNITALDGDITFSKNINIRSGGAICNYGGTTNITASDGDIIFSGNNSQLGGAIYNAVTTNITASGGDVIFSGNSASSRGGAIYNEGNATINLIADGGNILFMNNTSTYDGSDTYINGSHGILNLNSRFGSKIVFDDSVYISGSVWGAHETGLSINKKIGTDYTGTVQFNDLVGGGSSQSYVDLYNGTLKLGHAYQSDGTTFKSSGAITRSDINLSGGTIDMIDDRVGNYINTPSLGIAKDTTIGLKVDIDSMAGNSDYITAAAVSQIGSGTNAGKINISNINLLNLPSGENFAIAVSVMRGALIGSTYVTSINTYTDGNGNVYEVGYDNASGVVYLIKGSQETLNAYIVKSGDRTFNVTTENSDEVAKTIDVTNSLGFLGGTKLTINGNGYKIDGAVEGGGNYPGLKTAAVQELDINNASITNFAGTAGGFLNNSGTLTLKLDNVNFGERTGSGTTLDPYVYSNGNRATSTSDSDGGGAIYNTGTLNILGDVNFFGNSATIGNYYAGGGVIYNAGNLNISGGNITFAGNSVSIGKNSGGGVIYNAYNRTTNITADLGDIIFADNKTIQTGNVPYGGAIYNAGTINITSSGKNVIFSGNGISGSNGGAIYNGNGTINITAIDGDISFLKNTASGGGAIYNSYSTTLNLAAMGGDVLFSDNSSSTGAAISNAGTINMKTQGSNKIVVNDSIYNGYTWDSSHPIININKNDGTNYLGTVEFNNSVRGSSYTNTINLYNGVLKLGHTYQSDGTTIRSTGTIANNVLNLYGGTIDMMDGRIGNYINTPTLSIEKDSSIGLKFDVDLTNSTTDYFTLGSALVNSGTGTNNGVFKIDDINILQDATSDSTSVTLFTGANTPSLSQIVGATVDTTIYRYVVTQDSTNLGKLVFSRSIRGDDLYLAVKATDANRTLNLSSGISVIQDLDNMNGAGSQLTVNGGGCIIDGQGYTGVIVG